MWMFSVVAGAHSEYFFTFGKVAKYPVCECLAGSDLQKCVCMCVPLSHILLVYGVQLSTAHILQL